MYRQLRFPPAGPSGTKNFESPTGRCWIRMFLRSFDRVAVSARCSALTARGWLWSGWWLRFGAQHLFNAQEYLALEICCDNQVHGPSFETRRGLTWAYDLCGRPAACLLLAYFCRHDSIPGFLVSFFVLAVLCSWDRLLFIGVFCGVCWLVRRINSLVQAIQFVL